MKWLPILSLVVMILPACGGDLEVYNYGGDDADGASEADPGLDAGATDSGEEPWKPSGDDASVPDPGDAATTPDAEPLDADVPDTDPEPEPLPTTNAAQEGPTVEQQVRSACSTIAVKGLSLQLIEQMNCLDPGVMKSFEGAPSISYGPVVFPFLQGPATDSFKNIAANNSGTVTVNSALRTIPQQYLLYRWYQLGLCNANLAARPGRSNHNGGLAVDINDSSTWRSRMRGGSFVDNVSGEPWHFYFNGGGGKDVRNLSVLAFQQLYNLNFPENPITEDGLYGPQTEGAMQQSPANGFTRPPRCAQTMALQAFPFAVPLDLDWKRVGDSFVEARVVAPSGVQRVEYFVDGIMVAERRRDESNVFRAGIKLGNDGREAVPFEILGYNDGGLPTAYAVGAIDLSSKLAVFARPLGGDGFEIGVEPHVPAARVDVYVDGQLVDPMGRHRFESITSHSVKTTVTDRSKVEVDVVVYDAHGSITHTLSRTYDLSTN